MSQHPLLEVLSRISVGRLRSLRVGQLTVYADDKLWGYFGDLLVQEIEARQSPGAPRPEIVWPSSDEPQFLLHGHQAATFSETLPDLPDYEDVRLLYLTLARTWMREADLQRKLAEVGGSVN